jgi:hypothetical protein
MCWLQKFRQEAKEEGLRNLELRKLGATIASHTCQTLGSCQMYAARGMVFGVNGVRVGSVNMWL